MIRRIVKKIFKKVCAEIKKIKILLFSQRISDRKLLKILNKNNKEEIIEYYKEKKLPKFFINSKNKNKVVKILKEKFIEENETTIKSADEICEHIFDLLGSGEINLGKKINWHCDFKSGYCWSPKTFYLNIKYGDKEGIDVKVPWELSRCQHFATLGKAYWLTDEEKYTEEFINEIEDWIKSNPPQCGVNWKCTMDVAIRACNWILGFYFFKDSKEVNDKFLLKFLKSLLIHGSHIKGNLEYGKLTSNHYLSDIVGLVYLGIFFKDIRQGQRWLNFGIQELEREMQKQVYPDGCDFEASTCYHHLVLELFFFSTLLVVINDDNFNGENYKEITQKIFGKGYTDRLYKMFEAVLYLLKPNGRMPQIGDNDNGRLHIFTERKVLDMQYLLAFGAIFFKESKFKLKEFSFSEEALWIFGEKGYNIWQGLKENCLANIKSKAFSNAGWYIMRNNKDYCLVSCGPNGQNGNGGHCHNDKLSFELCIDGKDIIVDPGTYVYTPYPKWRNKFRSTVFHNTVVVDKEEQNRFIRNNLFSIKNDAEVKINQWKNTEEYDILDAEHYGYKQLKNPVIHQREIKFYKKEKRLEIIDKFKGKGEHNLKWNLILSLGAALDLRIHSDQLQWHKEPAFYSSEYGLLKKTNKFTATLKIKMPFEVKFLIQEPE